LYRWIADRTNAKVSFVNLFDANTATILKKHGIVWGEAFTRIHEINR